MEAITSPLPNMADVPNLVTAMNDAFRREAWDKSCTGIMYVTIEYPDYLKVSLLIHHGRLCECIMMHVLWQASKQEQARKALEEEENKKRDQRREEERAKLER